MRFRKLFFGFLFTTIILIASTNTYSKDTIVMKLGGINPPKVAMTQAHYKFADLVKEKSNGRIIIKVYPASQLGSATSQISQVMAGAIDMFGAADSFYSQYVGDIRVLSAPFLFDSEAHVKKFLASSYYKEMTDQLINKIGVRELVGGLIRPPEVLEATKPIRKYEDFKGLMMRVPEIEMYQLLAEALEARTVRVAWGEVYMALKQGVAEALIPPLDAIYPNKLHTAAPHILMTRHNWSRGTIIINEKRFQSFSPEDQKIMIEASKEVGEWFQDLVNKAVVEQVEKLKKEGAIISEMENPEVFKTKMNEMIRKLEAKGYWRKGLYADIQSLNK